MVNQDIYEFREKIQKEAIELALKNPMSSFDISMRLGKTNIMLKIASFYAKILVGYPSKSILSGWLADAKKFNINISNITFTTFRSLHKHNLKKYNCVLFDECHEISLSNWEYIIDNLPERLHCFSGSMPDRGDKKKFITTCCPVIYTKKLDETSNITSKDYSIIVHLIEPSSLNNILLKSGNLWSEKKKIAFFQSKYMRSHSHIDTIILIKTIQNSATKLEYAKKLANTIERSLIFLETSKQCEEFLLPTYNTKELKSEQNLEDFQNGKINKMTTISQLKSGITFKNLSNCIILHCYSSSSKSLQKIGRCLNFEEDVKATAHIICLNNTIDVQWVKKGLSQFNQNKIIWKKI